MSGVYPRTFCQLSVGVQVSMPHDRDSRYFPDHRYLSTKHRIRSWYCGINDWCDDLFDIPISIFYIYKQQKH